MNITWTPESWKEYLYWQKQNKNILKKINILIKEVQRTPYIGIGKPELLKHELAGCYSRRISSEHRLVYEIQNNNIVIISCKYHY